MENKIIFNNYKKVIKRRIILDNINAQFEKGKIYGFYGSNGSGKTMMFRAICGLIVPNSGHVKIFGKEVGKDIDFPEKLGVLIEGPGFLDYLTGKDNIKLLSHLTDSTEMDVDNALKRVGLNPNDSRKYKQYSLGMKQRLGVAQAIAFKPELLLLDEPTNALDEDGIKLIKQIIKEENERGTTIFLTSNNKSELDELCDQQYKIQEGKIVES